MSEFNGLQFNSWGMHEFRIYLDAVQVAAVPLNVIQLQQSTEPSD